MPKIYIYFSQRHFVDGPKSTWVKSTFVCNNKLYSNRIQESWHTTRCSHVAHTNFTKITLFATQFASAAEEAQKYSFIWCWKLQQYSPISMSLCCFCYILATMPFTVFDSLVSSWDVSVRTDIFFFWLFILLFIKCDKPMCACCVLAQKP